MNFAEAMQLVQDNPAGPMVKGVTRKAWDKGIVFYDATLFIGIAPFGWRYVTYIESDPTPYVFVMEDILAEDWVTYEWRNK